MVLTIIEIFLLLFGGMPLFDSITLSLGTAGTGGFGIKNDSIAGYSTYCQVIITIFMILFGINFNLYYFLLLRRFRDAFCSEEMLAYLGIVGFSTVTITLNILHLYDNVGTALRTAFFQVSSIITTTGYATVDFDQWPGYAKTVLVLLIVINKRAERTKND